jgi:hypothetical protein
MATTDTLEILHAATDRATIVTVPERRMYALDGLGDPSGAGYSGAIETLHAVAEQLRAQLHLERHLDTRVAAIECAWWTHPEPAPADVPERFADRATWHWQQMIEIPHRATDDDVERALATARRDVVRDAGLVRIIRFDEGLSAQILHVGPPAAAPDSVRRLFEAVAAAGLSPRGHLHEIHVSDPRHAPPERSRSILRLPVGPA